MPDPASARIFVSYSRKDGARFAKKLLKRDLSVWQDLVALEGGRDWWSQIEEAIRSKALQHFVLMVTPAALASPVVRREIRLARQEGKTFSPIKGPGLGELGTLPRWFGQVYDLDPPEHFTTLIRVLQDLKSVKGSAIEPLRPAWPSRHLVQSFGSSSVLRSGITVPDPGSWEVRWLTLARPLSGACAAPTARPAARVRYEASVSVR
jgi:hypothetical protein